MTFVRAPIVQGLWIGERLSEMEQLSIRSFLANGHDYHRYTFGPVAGVPEGAAVRDASEILPKERIWKYADQDSYAGYSNHFRYRLLYERGGIWADCDVVCLRPLSLREHAVASEDADDGGVFRATCVIAAPAGSALMRRAMQVCDTADVNTLKWGDTGPKLMTRLVEEMGFEDAPPSRVSEPPLGRRDHPRERRGEVGGRAGGAPLARALAKIGARYGSPAST